MRPDEPEVRSNDDWFSYLLAAPLPILFCLVIAAGWKRLSSRQASFEPEAPPLYKKKIPFSEIAQRKTRQMHEIKQVLDTRLRAGKGKKKTWGKGCSAGAQTQKTTHRRRCTFPKEVASSAAMAINDEAFLPVDDHDFEIHECATGCGFRGSAKIMAIHERTCGKPQASRPSYGSDMFAMGGDSPDTPPQRSTVVNAEPKAKARSSRASRVFGSNVVEEPPPPGVGHFGVYKDKLGRVEYQIRQQAAAEALPDGASGEPEHRMRRPPGRLTLEDRLPNIVPGARPETNESDGISEEEM